MLSRVHAEHLALVACSKRVVEVWDFVLLLRAREGKASVRDPKVAIWVCVFVEGTLLPVDLREHQRKPQSLG